MMISVPRTCAAAPRARAAAMPGKRRALSSGLLVQGTHALTPPTRLGRPRTTAKMASSSSSASIAVGAALATTTTTRSTSTSSQLPPPRSPRPAAASASVALAARAAAADTAETTPPPPSPLAPGPEEDAWRPGDPFTPFMADRARWLERDLPHLFDDVGIDRSGYAEVVTFRDPITSVSCCFF